MPVFVKLKIICPILFMIILIVNPLASVTGAKFGLTLWYSVLIPSIFPSMLISQLLINLNCDKTLNNICYPIFKHLFPISKHSCFPIVFSIIAGLPTGSAIIYQLYKSDKINIHEARYLLILTSSPSITFLINYVAYHILNNSFSVFMILFIVYISSYISSFIYYILHKKYFRQQDSMNENLNLPYTKTTNDIIIDSVHTITFVGIYVMIFSIIQKNISDIINSIYINTIISSFLEISNACNMCVCVNNLSIRLLFVIFSSTFCGICSFFQINSVACLSKNNILFIMKYKMLSAVCALSITLALLYIF